MITAHETFSDLESTRRWAKEFARSLRRPCVVRLEGEMGSGKTQTVRWFLEELGVKGAASPTFAIHHEYESVGGAIDHVDLYRLTGDQDLEATGFWDLFARPDGLVFVEWADRLPASVWPRDWHQVRLHLAKRNGEGRDLEIEIKPRG